MSVNAGKQIAMPLGNAEVVASGVDEDIDREPYEAVKGRKVLIQTYDFAVRQLMDMVVEGDLILDPDYQRKYRWADEKASRFVESIVLNIPVPVLYFAEEPDGTFSVIDGQQRLTSLFRYIKVSELANVFPDRGLDELVLNDAMKLRPDLAGVRFVDLSREDRSTLAKRAIRCIVVLNESDPTLKFEVFERLNSGSASLSDQEVRNCLYRGSFNKLIKNLAENKKFQEMVALPDHATKAMKDAELVLRFFAFREIDEESKYQDNYAEYLNNFMEENRELSPGRYAALEKLFSDTVDLIYEQLGAGVAFRKPVDLNRPLDSGFAMNLINGAVYESQMIVISRLLEGKGDVTNLKARVLSVFTEPEYTASIFAGTSKKGRVLRRNKALSAAIGLV
ncbi:DUF262 domain-containing protein [Stenotrophomonas pavanii]|uniref:DUF262 domain-containing protein n=1 Tax=Stenotrophomonas pavanii TaxID=487698 RepID=UPI00383A99CA